MILNVNDLLPSILFLLSKASLAELPPWIIRRATFGIQAKPVLFRKRSLMVTLHDFLHYSTLKVTGTALNRWKFISSRADFAKPVVRAKVETGGRGFMMLVREVTTEAVLILQG